ncbi:MAG: pirin family protein [Betaproteobacteria bacterium]
MIEIRRAQERGYADHGWLKSFHSFSFEDYYYPKFMHFGPLRVINEDRVAAGMGFGTHGHRDMEIVSYVLDGALAHKDSMGNGSSIRPGDVQRMSAGTGVQHSEFNHATDKTTHFLQIWIQPNQFVIPPSYEEKHFDENEKRGRLRVVASPDARDGSVKLHADAVLYAGLFDGAEKAALTIATGRLAYVHVASGRVVVNGLPLVAGDGLKLAEVPTLTVEGGQQAEVLVFDLASQ